MVLLLRVSLSAAFGKIPDPIVDPLLMNSNRGPNDIRSDIYHLDFLLLLNVAPFRVLLECSLNCKDEQSHKRFLIIFE